IKVANIRAGAGRSGEVEQIYRDLREQARQLAEAFPDDVDSLSERAWVELNHAWLLLNDSKHMSEGEREFFQARQWLEQAAARNPSENLHRERLAACWNDWAVFASAQERLTEARDAYRQVVRLETALVLEDANNRSYALVLGIANRNLARICGRLLE